MPICFIHRRSKSDTSPTQSPCRASRTLLSTCVSRARQIFPERRRTKSGCRITADRRTRRRRWTGQTTSSTSRSLFWRRLCADLLDSSLRRSLTRHRPRGSSTPSTRRMQKTFSTILGVFSNSTRTRATLPTYSLNSARATWRL